MKQIRYAFETVLAYILFYSFRMISMRLSSRIMGKLAKTIGPRMGVTKTARKNLALAMPELSETDKEQIVTDMWENLGNVIGEFPHMNALTGPRFETRVTIAGQEYIEEAVKRGKGYILFSGHFANWEIMPRAAAERGFPLTLIYRPANNPQVNNLIVKSRSNSCKGMFAKGMKGAKHIAVALKKGEGVGLLVDQKMNDGIPIPFFGKDAMTAPAMADLALRFDSTLLPAQIIRKKDTSFILKVHPPLDIQGKDSETIMTEANQLFETWIREYPAQWLWVHKRWPKE